MKEYRNYLFPKSQGIKIMMEFKNSNKQLISYHSLLSPYSAKCSARLFPKAKKYCSRL